MRKVEQTFGERLKQLRKKSGLTTTEVAKTCRVAESTYREWEYGRDIRGTKAYSALAMAFGVGLAELMMGEKGMSSSIDDDLKGIEEIIKTIRLKL